MKRPATKKLRPGWTRVTVDIRETHIAIARAIAATMAAEFPAEQKIRPYTMEEVLSGALDEGLISDEKCWLGTSSIDHSDRAWDTRRLPKTTRTMLALVRAVAGRSAMMAVSGKDAV